jgi:hypothetical protein
LTGDGDAVARAAGDVVGVELEQHRCDERAFEASGTWEVISSGGELERAARSAWRAAAERRVRAAFSMRRLPLQFLRYWKPSA